jgi:hypothetical protein
LYVQQIVCPFVCGFVKEFVHLEGEWEAGRGEWEAYLSSAPPASQPAHTVTQPNNIITLHNGIFTDFGEPAVGPCCALLLYPSSVACWCMLC